VRLRPGLVQLGADLQVQALRVHGARAPLAARRAVDRQRMFRLRLPDAGVPRAGADLSRNSTVTPPASLRSRARGISRKPYWENSMFRNITRAVIGSLLGIAAVT